MERSEQRLMIATFLVVCVFIVGMLTTQWILILYAGMILIGCCLLASLRKPIIPTVISLIYIVLFSFVMWLDIARPDTYILGWRPATFAVLYLVWPFSLILGIVYAIYFSKTRSNHVIAHHAKEIEN